MSGSATYKRNENKNQAAPWIGQQPFLTDVFSQAQGLYNQGTPGYYPGQTYTNFNDIQQQAMGQTLNQAQGTPQQQQLGDYISQSLGQPQFDLSNAGMQANAAAGGVQAGQQGLAQAGGPGIGAASRFAQGGSNPFSANLQANQGYGSPQDAQSFIGGPQGNYDPFSQFAQQSTQPGQSLGQSIGQAQDAAGSGVDPTAANALQQTARGDFVGGNPFLDDQFDQATRRVREQFQDTVTPGINATFGSAGRTGSGIHQEALSDAAGELGDTLGGVASDIYGNAYGQERSNQLSAAGQLGDLGIAGGQLGLSAAGLGSENFQNQEQRRLQGAGLGSDIASAQNADQLGRSGQALDSYLSERGLGQQATQFGLNNSLDQNRLAADLFNQGQNRSLRGSQGLLDGGLSGISGVNNLYNSVGQQQQAGANQVQTLNDLQYGNIDRIQGVGDQVRGLSDQALGDDINRFNYYQNAPRDQLSDYANIILAQQLNQSRGHGRGYTHSGGGGAGKRGG